MVMRLLGCLLLITAMPLWAANQLQASVDKNPVLAGEFFILTISVDDNINSEQPDTSVLLKDFVVGPTRVSSRTNIINGEISKQTNWSVKLMTRAAGTYTIPAFTVAGVSSQPIELKVAKRSQDNVKNKDAFIKTSLSPSSLFVQEAGVYTIKLYLAKELLDGNLTTPEMPDAQLSQIGKQSENYELIDGKRYLVISRDYLVQPQKSGVYKITAPAFNGRVRENYRQVEISALGENIEVEIKPIPDNYTGAWLPSELVSLDEQWQPKDDTVEVGTPITRTITLTALGITKEQLPDINMPNVTGIRSYPDDKENNHLVRDGKVISQQVASYALLPQTPGTYTLPEIKVPWYNTKIKRVSVATLPARTLTVVPSSNPLTVPPIQATPPTTTSSEGNTPQTSVIVTKTPIWLYAIATMGYLLWLVTLWLYFHARNQPVSSPVASQPSRLRPSSSSLTELKALAKTAHHSEFYAALLGFAQQQYKTPDALNRLLINSENNDLKQEIAKLQAKLYSSKDSQVNLGKIVDLLGDSLQSTTVKQSAQLKRLYD